MPQRDPGPRNQLRDRKYRPGAQRTRYRLLLVLSDGKPNDVDEYEERYGIEDTRQAIAEARRQGIVPFCLTVDRIVAPRESGHAVEDVECRAVMWWG